MELKSYNICTININNITNPTKLDALRTFVRSADLDVIFLQEVENVQLELPGFDLIFNVDERRRGTAIAVKQLLQYKNVHRSLDSRLISLLIGEVTFVNVYAPSGSQNRNNRESFFNSIVPFYLRTSNYVVFGGDFNCVVNERDATGSGSQSPTLKRLMTSMKLTDSWTELNGTRVEYSLLRHDSASRLDRILVGATMRGWLRNAYFSATAFTDHKAYTVRIVLPDLGTSAGRGVWNLFPKILDEPETLPELQRKWLYWVRNRRSFASWMDWWIQFCKPKLISFLKWKTSLFFKDFYGTMEIYQGHLLRAVNRLPGNQMERSNINRLKGQILQLQRNFATKLRRNNSSYVGGEQTSLFHLNERSTRKARTSINSLELQDGSVITGGREIQAEVSGFFNHLYAAGETSDTSRFLPAKSIPTDIEENITILRYAEEDEIFAAIKSSCSKKSPGADGLPKEFYLKCWRIISREFTLVVNDALSGNVPKSFLDGIVVLVRKKGNKKDMSAFRPISLLNFDFKTVSRILKQRMEKLVPLVLSPEQKCSNGSRTIFEATTRIWDKICEVKHRHQNALLVSFDLDHAFDRVDHSFLQQTMLRMNFNPALVELIKKFMENSFSRILVNGHLTPEIHIRRSVRQGDPLSMLLFVLYMQPLLDELRQTFPGAIINAYADDISMFVENEGMLVQVSEIFSTFGEESGAILNRVKTVGLMIGNINLTAATEWLSIENHVKILGIFYCENIRTARDLNWNAILSGIKWRIWEQSPRNLPLTQRVTLLNFYVCSKMWYVASNVYLPKNYEARIITELRKFLWMGHPPQFKISFQNLTLPKNRGGLNLHSPALKSKALLLNRLVKSFDHLPMLAEFLEASDNPPNVPSIPAEFQHARLALQEISYLPRNLLDSITANSLYQHYLSLLPDPAVFCNSQRNWKAVFKNIHNKLLPAEQRSAWFLMIHERIPHNELLHRQNPTNDPECTLCPGETDTIVHRIFKCTTSRRVWFYQKSLLYQLDSRLRRMEPEKFM